MTEAERQSAIDHMNADHGDAVLLYAQVFGGLPTASQATMTDLDTHAMRLLVQVDRESREVAIPLKRSITTLDAAREVLVEMVHDARLG